MSTALQARQDIQRILAVEQDGKIGPKTLDALHSLIDAPDASFWPAMVPASPPEVHEVMASSFADPADVAAFRHCKANGGTDQECFRVGDNGIGLWGDDTTADVPMCALPPEDWNQFGSAARGKKVIIGANGNTVVAELRDTMPHRAKIQNGAGIDMNPATVKALGLKVPAMAKATWQWA